LYSPFVMYLGLFQSKNISELVCRSHSTKPHRKSMCVQGLLGSKNGIDFDINTEQCCPQHMATALRHTLVEGHNPESGRFDGVRLAKALGLSVPEMARVLGYTPRGLRANPDSKSLQVKLGELVSLVIRLMEELDSSMENARIWLHAPHPDLGGVPPYQAMEAGDFEAVETLIAAMEEGTPLLGPGRS